MKRTIIVLLMVVALVAAMPMSVFAATRQQDLIYNGEEYTVYIRCDSDEAAANIRTMCTTVKVGVSCMAHDERGYIYESGASNRTLEACATTEPDAGHYFVDAYANYSVDGTGIYSMNTTP